MIQISWWLFVLILIAVGSFSFTMACVLGINGRKNRVAEEDLFNAIQKKEEQDGKVNPNAR